MERIISNTDWFIYVWLLSLLLVTAAKMVNGSKFSEFISISISKKFFLTAQREDNYLFNRFNIILFVMQVISLSLFLFIAAQHLSLAPEFGMGVYFKIVLFLNGFIIFKFSLEKVIGFLIGTEEFVNRFNFVKLCFRSNAAIFFVIINIALYLTESLSIIYIYGALSIYLIVSVVGFVRMFNFFQKEIAPHIFYFILYLCALEIAPYAILYKLLLD